MSEATATMEQVATAEGGQQSAGGSGQGSYVNDAWNDNYFRSHEAELNPDTAAKKAQVPKDTKTAQKPTTEGEQKQGEPPKEEKKQEDKQESQQSLFEKAFSDEAGGFKTDDFMNFNIPEMQPDKKPAEIGAQQLEKQLTAEEQWKKDAAEMTEYEKTLSGALLDPLNKAYSLIQSGTDPVQALKQVYDEQMQRINTDVGQKKAEREFKRQQVLEERLMQNTKTQAMREQIKVNTNEIASALPGNSPADKTALFNEILYGKDGGAKVLDYFFQEAFPDNEKMSPQERATVADKFLGELMSNKAKLRFVFDTCLNQMKVKNMPRAIQAERLRAVADDKANRLTAQKSPTGTQKRNAPPAQKGVWDNYLHSHYDRV